MSMCCLLISFVECQTTSTSAGLPLTSDISQISNFSNSLCFVPAPNPQRLRVPITFSSSVYLTQILVTGISDVVYIEFLNHTSEMIYENIAGIAVSPTLWVCFFQDT